MTSATLILPRRLLSFSFGPHFIDIKSIAGQGFEDQMKTSIYGSFAPPPFIIASTDDMLANTSPKTIYSLRDMKQSTEREGLKISKSGVMLSR